jgi:hypothetical protein
VYLQVETFEEEKDLDERILSKLSSVSEIVDSSPSD